MHWISSRPCMIADHVQAVGAAPAEQERFRAQAMRDWETILLARARELRAGGRLAFANFCIDEEGQARTADKKVQIAERHVHRRRGTRQCIPTDVFGDKPVLDQPG